MRTPPLPRSLPVLLALLLVSLGAAQGPLRFSAAVGTETRYRLQLRTSSSEVPYRWPAALPAPQPPATLLPEQQLDVALVETVVAPGRLVAAAALLATDFAPPCPLGFASGRHYQGASVVITLGGAVAELAAQLGDCYPAAEPAFLADYAAHLIESLALADITTLYPPSSLPLTPGSRRRSAELVPMFGGVRAEVGVHYLGIDAGGLHRFRIATFIPHQPLLLPGLGGAPQQVDLGPVHLDAEHRYHPDGRLASLQQSMELLSFSLGQGSGALQVLRQTGQLSIVDLSLDR